MKLGNGGFVLMVNNKPSIDSIYQYASFLSLDSWPKGVRSCINVSLIFEDLTLLNEQAKAGNKIIHHFIPVSFETADEIELEYNIF